MTFAGVRRGVRLMLPLCPGLAVFGAAYGAAAAQKGLGFWEAVGTSAMVYAGAAQMVSLELWRAPLTPAAVLGMVAVVLIVNARIVMMGATMQPWLDGVPARRKAVGLFFLTDASWLIAMQDRSAGGRDLGVYAGVGMALWPLWIGATAIGHLAGAVVAHPRAWGLDFIVPALFAATLVSVWRGPRAALPWIVSGVIALTVQALVPGYAYVVAGGLAGAAAGALLDDRG